MEMDIINEEIENETFDMAPTYYDKYRIGYPTELIDRLIEKSEIQEYGKILEIGSGSLKGTEILAKKGYNLTCIEPSSTLAAIGEDKFKSTRKVVFIKSKLENWNEPIGKYDLAIYSQAMLKLPKPIVFSKCARAIKDNKYISLLWNVCINDCSDLSQELTDLCSRYKVLYMRTESEIDNRIESVIKEGEKSGLFKAPSVDKFLWSKNYNYKGFINFLKTGNNYLELSMIERNDLKDKLKILFDKNGGNIEQKYEAVLYMAQKK